MRLITTALSILLATCCTSGSFAQSHQARIVVPFAAGGTADVLGRIIAQQLGVLNGNQVVVENRPGSGGNIGAEAVARGPTDGSVLLLGTIFATAACATIRTLRYR